MSITSSHNRTVLIVASSPQNSDLFYATNFLVPDQIVFLEHHGKRSLLLHSLERDRGKKEATVDTVFSCEEFQKKVALSRRSHLRKGLADAEIITAFLQEQLGGRWKQRRITVPEDFPLGLAIALQEAGLKLQPHSGPLYPERAIKTAAEVAFIEEALQITEVGMARGMEILQKSKIEVLKGRKGSSAKKRLFWQKEVLTSERLRQEIEITILRAGGITAGDSIVAGGVQACDPHQQGSGPLYADELIILDLFPKSADSHFYGDITRTVVRGKASAAQRHLWETCLAGQQRALKQLRPGAHGGMIHQAITHFFEEEGYRTEEKEGRWRGFFHGTGHGLGRELHEFPRFGKATLEVGNVFTIEPGLYIPEVGGVRHEDVVCITKEGHRMLSRFPKELEI